MLRRDVTEFIDRSVSIDLNSESGTITARLTNSKSTFTPLEMFCVVTGRCLPRAAFAAKSIPGGILYIRTGTVDHVE